MTMDPAAAAAEVLVAYWRREALDLDTRVVCGRLTAAVDGSGLLAAGVMADPAAGLVRLGDVLRRSARSKPVVAALVQRLAGVTSALEKGVERGRGRSRVNQAVNVSGNGNVVTTAGRDMFVGAPDRGARDRSEGGSEDLGRGSASAISGGTILITAANPVDLDPLRLGEEEREIRETLELSTGRERWVVHTCPALRLRDLGRKLQKLHPRILHFCGHATGEGLMLEDAAGESRQLASDNMADLFGALDDDVECLVLNACDAEAPARALSKHVPFVIGSPRAVTDEAAIAFSIGFYQGLGEGRDIRSAYMIGRVYMRDAGTPKNMLPRLIERSRSRSCGDA